jgi:ATP synthase protein I
VNTVKEVHLPADKDQMPHKPFAEIVGSKAARKLKAKKIDSPGIWFGLGMMGLIGWSVAIPTLSGAALGIWLDRHYPAGHSYTLALLIAGLCLGCFTAWHWVGKEQREMHDELKETNDEW